MTAPIAIVGAGQCAAQAIVSLRQLGHAGPIRLFGDEPHLPYQRPPLSKAFLAGETSAERLELKPPRFYEEQGVELHLGCRVARLRPAERRIETADGASFAYGKLLLATGMRSRPLALAGADLPGVHHIRTIRDVERLRAELVDGARLVVVGGGYIGLEAAAKARDLGLAVTVVEAAPRVMQRVVSPVVSEFFAALHAGRGVRILTETGVSAFEGRDRVTAVVLSDGARLPADMVLVAVGALPNDELAAAAGLAVHHGIVVDAAGRTSAPDIFAAGDVAVFPSALYGRPVRLESVQNAVDQAKAVAASMLDSPAVYNPVPWFWSDQYDIKLQIAGLSTGHDRVVTEGDPATRSFSLEYFSGSRLIAVDSINAPRSHMLARRRIAEAWQAQAA